MSPADLILGLVTLQRLAELLYAERNTRRLLAQGAVEVGAAHYPLVVLVHAGWLLSLWLLTPASAVINPWFLALYGLLQVGRAWVLVALGRFWTTRIISLPQAPLVTRGPYRFLKHPNYAIVAGEVAVLPLVFGSWEIALIFSVLNGAALAHRIRVEDRALRGRTQQAVDA